MLNAYTEKHDRWRNGATLTGILQVIDLDHPNAPKIDNLLSKALVLWKASSRAANASEQVIKSEGPNKKKTTVSSERHDEQSRIRRGDHRA
ncbi:unnamed protein product [Dovyalis caffra]|uniref:Uncharacterized protein n=1 Tax=Dovyalis caffra TaxID=77055 RepID=A0AAV1QVE4_9ROSI|nr:unnamed protein product [Dovyalis caffra]